MGGNRSKRRPNKRAASEKDNAAGVKARRQAAFQKNKKYLWPLLIHLLVFYAVYAYLVETRFYGVVFWTYFALTAAFSLAFVIYNRGFSRQRITPDMLPDNDAGGKRSLCGRSEGTAGKIQMDDYRHCPSASHVFD